MLTCTLEPTATDFPMTLSRSNLPPFNYPPIALSRLSIIVQLFWNIWLNKLAECLTHWILRSLGCMSVSSVFDSVPKQTPNEPWKKPSYFPLNPGCLIPGSLFHGLWNNPYITWVVFHPLHTSIHNRRFFFQAACITNLNLTISLY